MLEKILKLYVTSMAGDVRSPTPHLFGPPGCGKSTAVEQAAEVLGVQLHTINVSRISPLELEGVQMPVDGNSRLHMLTATFWTQLKEGDILLLDEFLRGFPEVYNGLLDILTSRRVGGYELPKVFIIAASNSTVAYDKALEDRLLHLPVDDPRHSKVEHRRLRELLAEAIGLLPEMSKSTEMEQLMRQEVLPTFDVLDQIKHGATQVGAGAATGEGRSIRNLIGQAQLREVQSTWLQELLSINNIRAMRDGKPQFAVFASGKGVPHKYVTQAEGLKGNPKLTEIQARNLEINLQLIGMEAARKEKDTTHDDDDLLG